MTGGGDSPEKNQSQGDSGGVSPVDSLFPQVYEELRGLAHHWLQGNAPGLTLQPTAVVHEAFLRLAAHGSADWADQLHLRAVAAKAMRQVIADHCRKRRAAKRGGDCPRVTLVEAEQAGMSPRDVTLFDLDSALDELATLNERQHAIVELRFLGGMTVPEIAQVLEVSERTVKLDWQMARAWLFRAMDVEP
jgi:RNA polymerase sigma factor (TIGR02999 family)